MQVVELADIGAYQADGGLEVAVGGRRQFRIEQGLHFRRVVAILVDGVRRERAFRGVHRVAERLRLRLWLRLKLRLRLRGALMARLVLPLGTPRHRVALRRRELRHRLLHHVAELLLTALGCKDLDQRQRHFLAYHRDERPRRFKETGRRLRACRLRRRELSLRAAIITASLLLALAAGLHAVIVFRAAQRWLGLRCGRPVQGCDAGFRLRGSRRCVRRKRRLRGFRHGSRGGYCHLHRRLRLHGFLCAWLSFTYRPPLLLGRLACDDLGHRRRRRYGLRLLALEQIVLARLAHALKNGAEPVAYALEALGDRNELAVAVFRQGFLGQEHILGADFLKPGRGQQHGALLSKKVIGDTGPLFFCPFNDLGCGGFFSFIRHGLI